VSAVDIKVSKQSSKFELHDYFRFESFLQNTSKVKVMSSFVLSLRHVYNINGYEAMNASLFRVT